MNNEFSKEVYDVIIGKSLTSEAGLYWPTYSYLDEPKLLYDLYSGNAGVLFSLITYYGKMRDDSLLEVLAKSANWIVSNYDFSLPPLFLSGELGIAFCFDYYEQITTDFTFKSYKQKLLNSVIEKLRKSEIGEIPSEYINGLSGIILGLNNIDHNIFLSNPALLDDLLFKALNNTFVVNKAIQWDFSNHNLSTLNGLSHGKSGIGYVLYSLGRTLNSDSLKYIGSITLKDESIDYNDQNKNWPDYRKGLEPEDALNKHIKLFKSDKCNVLPLPSYMNAWCHGAIGIGLTRLMLAKTDDESYLKEDLEKSISVTISQARDLVQFDFDPSLCHGALGHYALLKRAVAINLRGISEEELRLFEKEIQSQIRKKHFCFSGLPLVKNQDFSLFNGLAGVLQVFSEPECDKIFCKFDIVLPNFYPSLVNGTVTIDEARIKEVFLQKIMAVSWPLLPLHIQDCLINNLTINDIVSCNWTKIRNIISHHSSYFNLNKDIVLQTFLSNYKKTFYEKIRSLVSLEKFDFALRNTARFGKELKRISLFINKEKVLEIDKTFFYLSIERNRVEALVCNASETSILNFIRRGKEYSEVRIFLQKELALDTRSLSTEKLDILCNSIIKILVGKGLIILSYIK